MLSLLRDSAHQRYRQSLLQRVLVNLPHKWLRATFLLLLLAATVRPASAAEASSSSYQLTIPVVINGGGVTASSANASIFTAIGENMAYFLLLQSSSSSAYLGQGFLVSQLAVVHPSTYLIANLRAYAESLGSMIPPQTWQNDADPYFVWDVEVEPPQLVIGFSVALDAVPDETIDTESPAYQFAEGAIASGKHAFYVLPFTSDKGAEKIGTLSFEIWVDRTAPFISQTVPAAGILLANPATALSCMVYDNDAGLDLERTTISMNARTVGATYDAENKLLEANVTLAEGPNSFLVRAYDLVGNYVTKAWDCLLDSQPPSGSILINGGQGITYSAYVNISVDASDATTSVVSVYLSNDGVFDTELNSSFPYRPLITGWLVSDPDTDGHKIVYAKFRDTAGNLSSTVQAAITLKRLTPETRIISGPASVTEKTDAAFQFDASRSGCLFSYRLDDGGWSGFSSSNTAQVNGLSEGNHYLYAKAGFDLDGDGAIGTDEADPTPAQWTWTVRAEGAIKKIQKRILFWRR